MSRLSILQCVSMSDTFKSLLKCPICGSLSQQLRGTVGSEKDKTIIIGLHGRCGSKWFVAFVEVPYQHVFWYVEILRSCEFPEAALLESPIEEQFWQTWRSIPEAELYYLEPQFKILDGKYRLDFAFPDYKVGIELDGYEFHSSREQFTQDRQRQREIEAAGWRILRFSGREVNQDALSCVKEVLKFLEGHTP